MSRLLLVFFLALTSLTTMDAQKFGHVNFGNLLNEMPATTAADKQLETYQKQLVAKGEEMAKKLQEDFLNAQKAAPTTAPVELEKTKQDLARREQELRLYEQQMAVKLEEKRRELLGPIIQQAKDAIKAVGKEQGFQMIFDSSLFNSLLFTQEGTDLLPAVKAKLGI